MFLIFFYVFLPNQPCIQIILSSGLQTEQDSKYFFLAEKSSSTTKVVFAF